MRSGLRCPSQQGRPDIAAGNIYQAFKTRVLTFLKHGSVERIHHSLISSKTENKCPQCKPNLQVWAEHRLFVPNPRTTKQVVQNLVVAKTYEIPWESIATSECLHSWPSLRSFSNERGTFTFLLSIQLGVKRSQSVWFVKFMSTFEFCLTLFFESQNKLLKCPKATAWYLCGRNPLHTAYSYCNEQN